MVVSFENKTNTTLADKVDESATYLTKKIYTNKDILIFSLKKMYSAGCMFDGQQNDCFRTYFEYYLKEVKKYILKYHPIGYSLIPYILTKDLEWYLNRPEDNNSNKDVKDALIKIARESWLDAVKMINRILDVLRLPTKNDDCYPSVDDNFFVDESKLFECIIIFITELFKINLLHLDCYKFYETLVTKSGIKSYSEFSRSTTAFLIWDKFLDALNSLISNQTDCYREFMFCVSRLDSSFKSSVKLSLVSLGYMLKICKKLFREYKENVNKINKDLHLIYSIVVLFVIVHYLYGISMCLNNIISLSKWYKIKDESMKRIIKIYANMLRDFYKIMFFGKNKVWPKDKVSKHIYLKLCDIGGSLTYRLQILCEEYFTEENKYDKYGNLRYWENIVGIALIMRQVLRTIKKS